MKTKPITTLPALALIPALKPALALFPALILLSLFGCSKYEDGPWISFRSPENRIVSNNWHVQSFTKNEVDLTSDWKNNFDWGFEFENHDEEHPESSSSAMTLSCRPYGGAGAWSFHVIDFDADIIDETKLYMLFWKYDSTYSKETDTIGIFPLQTNLQIVYQIKRLTANELWLRYEEDNDVYDIHFKE